jgi:anti-sigma factor RsiW
MSDPSPHPTREELSAYSLGQLPQERAAAIDRHISACQPCSETIVGISSDDTFVGLLKEARQLPTDQTVDHGVTTAPTSYREVPSRLAEHPRYEVLGLIGKGGMGDVYKARHRKMERTVALKVINRGLVRKAEAIDRFHREVKAAAQLASSAFGSVRAAPTKPTTGAPCSDVYTVIAMSSAC